MKIDICFKQIRKSPVLFLSLLLACASPQAKVVNPNADLPPWAIPYYFSELPFSLDDVVPAPALENSPQDRMDLMEVKNWQKKRTPVQCQIAHLQEIPNIRVLFSREVVKDKGLPRLAQLPPEKFRKLDDFFERFQRDVFFVAQRAKEHFYRKRPYERDPSIQPCIKLERSFSYPSGHAAMGKVGGEILGEVFPEKRDALRKAGEKVGWNRVIGGVHHPSDVEGGFTLGQKTIEALMKNPRFQADLADVKRTLAN